MTPAEHLALVREAEEARAQLYRGGITPDHRRALEARVAEIVKVQIDEENAAAAAARPPPTPLSDVVKALSPAQAAAKAAELRRDPKFFSHMTYENRREIEALRADVAALDRRASETE